MPVSPLVLIIPLEKLKRARVFPKWVLQTHMYLLPKKCINHGNKPKIVMKERWNDLAIMLQISAHFATHSKLNLSVT